MSSSSTPSRWPGLVAVLLLLLLPAAILGPCLFGGLKYLPFDPAEFAPTSVQFSAEQLATVRAGANYDATEAPTWFVPELQLAKRALDAGEYPHWNPYVRGGAPLTAHGHLGLLNPLHWPALLFGDPVDGLLYLTYAMFALGGLLAYGFLRELGLDVLPAGFGALAFALSGTMTANGHWFMRMEPLALLPGLLWAALRMSRVAGTGRILPALGFALCLALSWMAGFPPYCLPVTMIAGAWCLCLLIGHVRNGSRAALSLALWFGGATLLGFGLAAVQLLQQVEFFPLSNRLPAPDLASISVHAFDPMGLLGYVLPDAFGHPTDRTLPYSSSPLALYLFSRTEWGTGTPQLPNYNFTEYALFPGTLTLLLAVLGVCARGFRFRWLLPLTIVGLFLLAIGPGVLHRVYALPGIQAVPPMRFVGPVCLFVAALAALGLQALWRGAPVWTLRLLAGLAGLGAVVCLVLAMASGPVPDPAQDPWVDPMVEHYQPLAPGQVTRELVLDTYLKGPRGEDYLRLGRERLEWNLRRAGFALLIGAVWFLLLSLRGARRPLGVWLGLATIAFTTIELWAFGYPLNRGRELPHAADSPVHQYLREQRGITAPTGGFTVARAHTDPVAPLNPLPGLFAKDFIRDLHFYTFVDGASCQPLFALYPKEFFAKDYFPAALTDDPRLELPWWDAIGLRYLLSPVPLVNAGERVGPAVEGPSGEFFLYERRGALPRAWVVPALREVPDEDAAVRAAVQPDFDPRGTVLVAPDQAELLGPALEPEVLAADRQVTFTDDGMNRVVLQVEAGAPGYLVLADTHLPGWRATLDGKELAIARGNVSMRVLPLPAEACEVRFTYVTPGLRRGLVFTGLALLVALALLVVRVLRRGENVAEA